MLTIFSRISRRKKIAALLISLGMVLIITASVLYAAVYTIQMLFGKPQTPESSASSTPTSTLNSSNPITVNRKQNVGKSESAPRPKSESKIPVASSTPAPTLSYAQCENLVASNPSSIPPECQSAYNNYQARLRHEQEKEAQLREQQAREASQRDERERLVQRTLSQCQEQIKTSIYEGRCEQDSNGLWKFKTEKCLNDWGFIVACRKKR